MNCLKKAFLVFLFSFNAIILFSQKIEFVSNNIIISISLEISKGEVCQSWDLTNKNNFPIFIPADKPEYGVPKYEAAKIGNEILVSVGYETLTRGIPLETKTNLLKLDSNVSLHFIVHFNDFRFKDIMDKTIYDSYPKNISFDYITEEDLKKISRSNLLLREMDATRYSELVKYINFRFTYVCN